MDSPLIPFFNPRGVVVIGASTSPEKLGYGVARNLVHSGYEGAIHFVSQKQGELFERPLYTDLAHVPDPVDLAILIVPPHSTPETIKACAERGIHAAIIVSSGFREAGAEGLLARLVDIVPELAEPGEPQVLVGDPAGAVIDHENETASQQQEPDQSEEAADHASP